MFLPLFSLSGTFPFNEDEEIEDVIKIQFLFSEIFFV
jgi:hypothetical protein